jgi:hypothetical protein
MPVNKTFSDDLWQRLQVASTIIDLDAIDPLEYIRGICAEVLNTPDYINEVNPDEPTLDMETARANAAEQEMVRQREIITRLLAQPPPDQQEGRGDKLPDAPMFDGTRDKLRSFVTQLRLKLFSDASRFPTARLRVSYAISRLEGRAMEQLLPYIRDNGQIVNLEDVEHVISILQTTFGDPDRAATARHKLQALRQGNKEFSVYYAEFSKLVSELDWDERATMDALRNGLSIEILEKLIGAPTPDTIHDFVNQCQALDSQIRAVENLRKLRSGPSGRSTTTPRAPVAPAPAPKPQTTTTQYGPTPMDLSANRRKITPQERAARLAEGRCLYCGGHGHMAAACPNKPATLRAAATVTTTPETPGIPDESGKA